jgi:hypothetical protein
VVGYSRVCVRHRIYEIDWDTRKVETSRVTAQRFVRGLSLVNIYGGERWGDESAGGEADGADGWRWMPKPCCVKNVPIGNGLAVEVLTALGKRDGAVRDSELRTGGALLRSPDEHLSVQGSGRMAWRRRHTHSHRARSVIRANLPSSRRVRRGLGPKPVQRSLARGLTAGSPDH